MNTKYLILLCLLFVACSPKKAEETQSATSNYQSFGEPILATEATPVAKLTEMKEDSVYTRVAGTIVDVCQVKGCWMKLDLGNNETMRVTFKDYGFFVPKDSKGREVIIEGAALRTITSVEDLRHYAEDAGKSAEEIAQITEPKQELAFEAVGVLMKE